MSREQVIAEVLRDIDTFYEAVPVATVREYIDRLSAAEHGGDHVADDLQLVGPDVHTPAAAQGGDADYECRAYACKRIRAELQARNAEMAAEIVELDQERARQASRVFEERSKLSALLAGIAGLAERLSQPRTMSQFMGPHDMALALVEERAKLADDLKAFREGVAQ